MKLHKLNWHVFSVIPLLVLTACGSKETPAPTMDTVLIFTQAAQTVSAQFTQTAAALPTATPSPTATPTQAVPVTFTALGTQPIFTLPFINTQAALSPTLSLFPPQATRTGALCNNSAFVADVGVPDNAVLKPGQSFEKGWLVQNTGTCNWGAGYSLVRVGGNTTFDAPPYVINNAKDFVLAGQVTEITLRMVAPKTPGKYEAHYQLYSNLNEPFGTGLNIYIEVRR